MSNIFKTLDWASWLYALLKAAITGISSAVLSYVAMPVMTSMGITMPTLTFKQLGVLMGMGALTHLAAILMKSPLPPKDGSPVDDSPVNPKQ